jgi:biotin-(acetyl-CoA carboxylase) ligase
VNQQRAYTLADGSAIEGIIVGLDESGRLLVQVGDQIRHFRNKELQFNY